MAVTKLFSGNPFCDILRITHRRNSLFERRKIKTHQVQLEGALTKRVVLLAIASV